MAIFKDKTGRGEVNYAKSPVLGSDGTILFLNDHTGNTANVFAFDRGLQTNHLVFQLRGESAGVQDVSANNFSITESSSLVKRLETVAHNTKLKTFEFSGGKTISLTPKVQPKYTSPTSATRPRLGRDQTHGSSPIETIIPVTVQSSKIGDEGAPEVIISFWVYINEYGTGSDGGGSCVMEQVSGTARTFGVIISSEGELVFRWYDWGANSTNALDFQQIKTQRQLKLKNWYHVTVFVRGGGQQLGVSNNYSYNTSGLDSKHQHHSTANGVVPQVAIFIDGQEQYNPSELGKTSGTFTGTMSSDPLFPLVLGTGLGGHDNSPTQFQSNAHFEGRLAEVSYFYTHRLARHSPDPQEYRSTVARALFTGKKQPTSGVTNISERLLLRDLDQNSTHPTVKRSGDIRRLGNHKLQFDDSRAQTLKGSTLQYPTKLVDGDKLIDTIYSGYNNGNLLVLHTASIESYDTFYRRNDQPSHEPFVESRIFVDENSAFYQTGTLESVLPGFDRPLRQKDVVKIEFNNQQTCELGPDHTAATNVERNSNNTRVDYMAYWNTQGFFEKRPGITFHDGGHPGKNTSDANILTGSNIGFVTSRTVLTGTTDAGFDGRHNTNANKVTIRSFPDDYYQAFGRPTSLFGFPDGARYNATGSNLINMSDYISEPFLVEKIVYYFDDLEVNLFEQHNTNVDSTGYGFDGFNGFLTVHNNSQYGSGFGVPGDYHIQVTAGLTGIHCFLMRQYDGKPSGSRNFVYRRKTSTQNLFTAVNNAAYQTKESRGESGVDSQRDLIDYHTRYFTNPVNIGVNGSGNNVIGFNAVTAVTISNTEALIISETAASSSITDMEAFLLSTFEKNNCAELEYLESNFSTASKTFNRVRLESTVKTAQQRDFTGAFMTNLPNNLAADGAIASSWSGNAANNSNAVSSRHIVKGTSGKKNPLSFEVVVSGGSNPAILPATAVTVEGSGDAPYILTPSDKLIFGVQAPSPKSSFQDIPNSSIQIKTGKVCIELYGSYVRNSQPRQFELNQLLNNDIVHEAIGAEPISDQFDLENLAAFTGSYVDEVMSGSITAPYRGFDAHTNKINDLARRVGSRVSEGNVGNEGSLRRTLSIAAEDKTELDSFSFDLESIFKKDERSGLSTATERSYLNDFDSGPAASDPLVDYMLLGDDPTQKDGGNSDPELRPNTNLKTSYLFSRYHDITRVRQEQIFAANKLGLLVLTGSNLTLNSTLFGYLDQNPESDPVDLDGEPTPDAGRHVAFIRSITGPVFAGGIASILVNPKETASFLFGLGDGVLSSHYYTGQTDPGDGSSIITINNIRGFKYGLSNLGDKKPRNIFRRDRYGQLRDMLEMAPNTAYVDDKSNTTAFPIEAQFFAEDGSIAAPNATSCSNLSTNLTSSAPFFDRDVVDFEDPLVIRNRGPLNNKVVDITIEI